MAPRCVEVHDRRESRSIVQGVESLVGTPSLMLQTSQGSNCRSLSPSIDFNGDRFSGELEKLTQFAKSRADTERQFHCHWSQAERDG
jgi:hypothetical protein